MDNITDDIIDCGVEEAFFQAVCDRVVAAGLGIVLFEELVRAMDRRNERQATEAAEKPPRNRVLARIGPDRRPEAE